MFTHISQLQYQSKFGNEHICLGSQNGDFAQISINCRVFSDEAGVEIDEHFGNYQPPRKSYEIVVFAGGQVFKQQERAGQGHIRVHLP